MKTNRRAFIALGAAAATGLVRGQSAEIRRRVQKKDPDPLRDVPSVTDAELEAAIKTLEETTLRDEEARAAAYPVIQRAIDRMEFDVSFKDAIREASPAKKVAAALAK